MTEQQREAFESWYNAEYVRPIIPADRTEGGYQHPDAQSAWDAWQAALSHAEGDELCYTHDGALAECPCCGSLDVGGAGQTVSCYMCGLSVTKTGPLQNAIDAWNKRTGRTHPAPQVDQEPFAWVPEDENNDSSVIAFGIEDRDEYEREGITMVPLFKGHPAPQVAVPELHTIATLDEIDAARVGMAYLQRVIDGRQGDPHMRLEHFGLRLDDPTAQPNGGVQVLWSGHELLAFGLYVRDEQNRTAGVFGSLAVAPTAPAGQDHAAELCAAAEMMAGWFESAAGAAGWTRDFANAAWAAHTVSRAAIRRYQEGVAAPTAPAGEPRTPAIREDGARLLGFGSANPDEDGDGIVGVKGYPFTVPVYGDTPQPVTDPDSASLRGLLREAAGKLAAVAHRPLFDAEAERIVERCRVALSSPTPNQREASHVTPTKEPLHEIADALDCFWNAATGAAHGNETVGAIAQGLSAVAERLREHELSRLRAGKGDE